MSEVIKNKKSLHGVVVGDSCDKTLIVKVERKYKHKLYRKIVKSHKKYAVHDENNRFKCGDLVTICESRPISKTKRWTVLSDGNI